MTFYSQTVVFSLFLVLVLNYLVSSHKQSMIYLNEKVKIVYMIITYEEKQVNHVFFINFVLYLQRGATIVYATHIFDGLETWATHLAYIQDGELRKAEKLTEIDELKNSCNLLSVVETWLRSETKLETKKPVNPPTQKQKTSPFGTSPFVSSRHMAYYR